MSLVASEGLMLRIAPHGESDKLATWYDARLGRVTAIAKGAQKSKKRFMNKLEPFSQLLSFGALKRIIMSIQYAAKQSTHLWH